MNLAYKISRPEPPTAGAAAQSSVAAPGPIACPYPFPILWHRTVAQVDAAELAAAEQNAGRETADSLAPARSQSSFHANLNTMGEQRNHGA